MSLGQTDEFVEPTVVGATGTIDDGDGHYLLQFPLGPGP